MCIALAVMLLSALIASAIQTNGYKTQVYSFKIPTSNGKYISCNMYRPYGSTADNPVPLVIACAGSYANKEQMGMVFTELPRRGIAVITFDTYMHGLSSGGTEPYSQFAWTDAGMIALVEYAYNNLDFIQKDKISIIGHSLGSRIVSNTLAHYGLAYENAIKDAMLPDSEDGKNITEGEQAYADSLNKVYAAFCLGVVPSEISFGTGKEGDTWNKGSASSKEFPTRAYANVAVCNGRYDEFYRGLYRDSDGNIFPLTENPYMLSLVSSATDSEYDALEFNTYYGDISNRSLRVIFNPNTFHTFVRYSGDSAAYMAEFFSKVYSMEFSISPTNQVWFLKEIVTFIGFIGLLLFIVPCASLLLHIPFFASIQEPLPAKLPAVKGKTANLLFWGGLLIIPIASYLLLSPANSLANTLWPTQAAQNTLTWTFPQKMTNFIFIWATLCGIVALALFLVAWRYNKRNGVQFDHLGIRVSVKNFFKSVLLALCVLGAIVIIAVAVNYFFTLDFRFLTLGFKSFKPIHLLYAAFYSILFFFYYTISSIMTNSLLRVDGQPEWLNLLLAGLSNVGGLLVAQIAMVVIMSSSLNNPFSKITLNLMTTYHLVILLFVVPYVNRYLYKLTGKVWLGAAFNCFFIVLMSVASNMLHVPAGV
ncbi:MAG: alpha/beta fold hydrolase [Oscillospiraceae bacterium]|nr:alpha/beta fold hydrolase [Oscillospiraceae bacterium]